MGGRAALPIAERIKSRIKISSSGCWIWQGSLNRGGYGWMSVGSRSDGSRRNAYVHRISYTEFVGPVPEGLDLDHLCRNPPCVNPTHLEPVTKLENRRRRPVSLWCPHGHRITNETVEFNARGARVCVPCRRLSGRLRERKRAALRRQKAG